MPTTRRDLLKTAAAGAIGFGLSPRAFAQGAPPSMPQRPPRQAGPLPGGIFMAAQRAVASVSNKPGLMPH